MDEKKQIEGMARVLCGMASGCDKCMFNRETCYEHKEAEELYNAGYRKQSGWISVEERLPQECTQVIVCDEDWTVGEAFYYKEGRFEWIDSEELVFVTHWMQLPEPPKGE